MLKMKHIRKIEKMKTQMLNKSLRKGINKMRKYIYLSMLISLFVIGCSEESSLVTPNNTISNNEPNWIVLPASENLSLNKDISVSQMVYGNQETLLEINTGYAGGPHSWISITANARFQRNSFVGQRYTTLSVNDQFGTATFSPSGTFLKPVIYNLTIMGLDLSNVDPSKVSFVYMASDGSFVTPKYDRIYVEIQSGKLQIVNAELPHFSRYGFVN